MKKIYAIAYIQELVLKRNDHLRAINPFEEIEKLLQQSNKSIIFELGVGLQYEYAPPDVFFAAAYQEIGISLWTSAKYELHNFICNEKGQPAEWANEFLTGDLRNLILGLTTAITSKFDVSLGIAVPMAALIIKKGIISFCRAGNLSKPRKDVKTLLKEKKEAMQEMMKETRELKKLKGKKAIKANDLNKFLLEEWNKKADHSKVSKAKEMKSKKKKKKKN